MNLNINIKNKIKEEYELWSKMQYAGKSLKERQEFGQFFTPPELTIQMIEKFDNLDGTILDPCAGCGGLLAACIMAGARPENIYGIELDPTILDVCKQRLLPLGVPETHLHLGDALDERCYEFGEDYVWPVREFEEVSLF